MNKKFVILVAVVLLIVLLSQVTIFEDGSWAFAQFPYPFSGCFPWGICN